MTVRDGWMVGGKERDGKTQARQKTTHKYPWPDERQEKRRGREGRKGREREGERESADLPDLPWARRRRSACRMPSGFAFRQSTVD